MAGELLAAHTVTSLGFRGRCLTDVGQEWPWQAPPKQHKGKPEPWCWAEPVEAGGQWEKLGAVH